MRCSFVKPLLPRQGVSADRAALKCLTNQWTRSLRSASSVAMAVTAPVVRLKPGKSKMFYGGNMIVLENSVDQVSGDGCEEPGVMATLVDHNEKLIGWGALNTSSFMRIRMLHHVIQDGPVDTSKALDVEKMLRRKLSDAVELRRRLGLPSERTTSYRLVHSEGDGLSGLCVDVYGTAAVVESSAAWVERYQDLISSTLEELLTNVDRVIWRRSPDKLRMEGSEFDHGNLRDTGLAADDSTVVMENGLQFEVSLSQGQKTGYYCDQRENRARIGELAKGADVLDCFSYTGGFGIYAAANGASSVTMVDSSASALEVAERNAQRNSVSADIHRADVFQFLEEAFQAGRKWDIVVVDPPKYAPKVKALQKASRKYRDLNKKAMKVVTSGGLLLSCTCSRAMTASGTFMDVIEAAAKEAGKRVVVLDVAGASSDHLRPISMPETGYLTAVLLAVHDTPSNA